MKPHKIEAVIIIWQSRMVWPFVFLMWVIWMALAFIPMRFSTRLKAAVRKDNIDNRGESVALYSRGGVETYRAYLTWLRSYPKWWQYGKACHCWVGREPAEIQFGTRFGAHNPMCAAFAPSLDPVDAVADAEQRLQAETRQHREG